MSDHEQWWTALVRIGRIVHSPYQTLDLAEKRPIAAYTFSHLLVLKLIISLSTLYVVVAGSQMDPVEEFAIGFFPISLQVLMVLVIDVIFIVVLMVVWLRMAQHRYTWSWLFSVGCLAQVPRLIEGVIRLLVALLMAAPESLPSQISFGPLIGVTSGPALAVLNPFMYWQSAILVIAVRNFSPYKLPPTVMGAVSVVFMIILAT